MMSNNWETICAGAWIRKLDNRVCVSTNKPHPFSMCAYDTYIKGEKEITTIIAKGCDTAKQLIDNMFPLEEINIIKHSNLYTEGEEGCSSYSKGKCLDELEKYCDGCYSNYITRREDE